MELTPLDPDGLARTGSVWSQAVIAGDLVFVSGQVAWNHDGQLIGGDSVSLQSEAVFDNIERALSAAGSAIERLVRICVYLVDRDDVAAFRAVRDRRLQGARPASTLVIVEALVDERLRVEIDAVAAHGAV